MTKPKTLEQLRAEKERAETQLAQEKHKLNRLENRKKYQRIEFHHRTNRGLPSFHLIIHLALYTLSSAYFVNTHIM